MQYALKFSRAKSSPSFPYSCSEMRNWGNKRTPSQAECCHSPSKIGTGLGMHEEMRMVLGMNITTCPRVTKPEFALLLHKEDGLAIENMLGLKEVQILQSSATWNSLNIAVPDGKRLGNDNRSPKPRGLSPPLFAFSLNFPMFPQKLPTSARTRHISSGSCLWALPVPVSGTALQTAPGTSRHELFQVTMPLTKTKSVLPSSSSRASGWETKIGSDGYESGSCHTQVSLVLTFSLQS